MEANMATPPLLDRPSLRSNDDKTEALLQRALNSSVDDRNSSEEPQYYPALSTYLPWFLLVNCQALAFGFTISFTGPTIMDIIADTGMCGDGGSDDDDDDIDICEKASFVASCYALSAIVGALVAGPLVDSPALGRRIVYLCNACILMAGWVAIGLSGESYAMLVFGRLLTGLGTGICGVVTPMYSGEVSPPHLRGSLGSLFNLGIATGVLGVMALSTAGVSWRLLAALYGTAPQAVCFLSFLSERRLPESPEHLAAISAAAHAALLASRRAGARGGGGGSGGGGGGEGGEGGEGGAFLGESPRFAREELEALWAADRASVDGGGGGQGHETTVPHEASSGEVISPFTSLAVDSSAATSSQPYAQEQQQERLLAKEARESKARLVRSLACLHRFSSEQAETQARRKIVLRHQESLEAARAAEESGGGGGGGGGAAAALVAQLCALCSQRYVRAAVLALGTTSGFALSAVNCISAFTAVIFADTSVVSVPVGNLCFALAQWLVILLGIAWFYEAFGRRPLLIASAAGCAAGHACLFAGYALGGGNFLVLLGPLLFIGAVSVGLGSVSWVYAVEVLPGHLRGLGLSIGNILFWAITWALNQYFQDMLNGLGDAGTFLLFAAISMTTCAFFNALLVETRGRTFAEISSLVSREDSEGAED